MGLAKRETRFLVPGKLHTPLLGLKMFRFELTGCLSIHRQPGKILSEGKEGVMQLQAC